MQYRTKSIYSVGFTCVWTFESIGCGKPRVTIVLYVGDCPRLLKYNAYMEENRASIAKRFLEHLKEECDSLSAISDVSVKLKTIQVVFDIVSTKEYLETIYNKLLVHPLYDIDRDIDYGEWANYKWKNQKVIRLWNNAKDCYGYMPDVEERKKAIDTIYSSVTIHGRDKDEGQKRIEEEKSKLHSAIDVLLSDVYLGSDKIDVAINNGLMNLKNILSKIDDVIKKPKRDNVKFALMVDDILSRYKAKMKALDPNFKEFNEWKEGHQDIDEDMYERYLAKILLDFLNSDFLQYDIEEICTSRAENIYKDSQIEDLSLNLTEKEKIELKRKYYKLRKLVGFENGRFDFSKKGKLGFHIYHYRHKISQDGIDGLVRFMQITEFIYEDLDMYNSGESLNETEELKCPFCEEQIENCIIKRDAKIWLTVIYNYRDELAKNKSLWLSVYAVLVSYNTIDDNVRSFCNMVMVYFEQKLDNSNISREWKKIKGEKIEKWETTQRNERRVSLAKEMSERYRKIKATL